VLDIISRRIRIFLFNQHLKKKAYES